MLGFASPGSLLLILIIALIVGLRVMCYFGNCLWWWCLHFLDAFVLVPCI